jgi:hypothetical protein
MTFLLLVPTLPRLAIQRRGSCTDRGCGNLFSSPEDPVWRRRCTEMPGHGGDRQAAGTLLYADFASLAEFGCRVTISSRLINKARPIWADEE